MGEKKKRRRGNLEATSVKPRFLPLWRDVVEKKERGGGIVRLCCENKIGSSVQMESRQYGWRARCCCRGLIDERTICDGVSEVLRFVAALRPRRHLPQVEHTHPRHSLGGL